MATAQHNRYALLSGENSPQRGSPETTQAPGALETPKPASVRRPMAEKKPWRSLQSPPDPKKKSSPQVPKKSVVVPSAVMKQLELRKKHIYSYRLVSNGNVENNCTLYVNTGVAHARQIEEMFIDAIERAKKMPDVFGSDFDCEIKVNVVRRHSGEYMAYAFVDLTNPRLYYALIGCNVDGSERAHYIDDPNWTPPLGSSPPTGKFTWASGKSWADDDDNEPIVRMTPCAPKIRRELPPLLTLKAYTYDKQQMAHLQTQETQGTVTVSPAFITPGISDEYDDCSLYVSEVPDMNYDFLYEIFARYARTSSSEEDASHFFPRITIRQSNKEGVAGLYAIVQYAHPYDASYALQMLQKIRAKYNGADVSMPVRHAFDNRRKKKQ